MVGVSSSAFVSAAHSSQMSHGLAAGTAGGFSLVRSTHHYSLGNGSDGAEPSTTLAVLGITSLSILAAVGTLWSEVAILITRCGPRFLPDEIERGCYLGVIVVSGLSLFLRIVTGHGLATFIINNSVGDDAEEISRLSLQQLKICEQLSNAAVVFAFVALGAQLFRQEQIDGMSGINVEMCRAIGMN
ncbi:hypothetical protein THAOC_23264 [Thalassiosira oceanica]|uniref:Uncharacterized protein n=1 Tax=Thalassiosira oceanica TaxID=159749 RepID=K0RWH5_THAOC|nr:hypothetical protein THAOC_23264 [Thalassiosira oceanica]|eukprot:EJK56779.1 hypothetical protein THAOC_23264 [Thalassiosira oceanica]